MTIMKRVVFVAAVVAVMTSCAPSVSSGGGELVGVKGMAWAEPTPYGKVLIDRGSFVAGCFEADSVWGTPKNDKSISVDAF